MKFEVLFTAFRFAVLLLSVGVFSPHVSASPGMAHLLHQLAERHGDYRVKGRLSDGVECEITVSTTSDYFRFTFNDDLNEPEPLEVLTLLKESRMVFFDLKETPVKRTQLILRDRVPYVGSAPREVDVHLTIEESADSKRVFVVYEDRAKHRRWVCQGTKFPGLVDACMGHLKTGERPPLPRGMN